MSSLKRMSLPCFINFDSYFLLVESEFYDYYSDQEKGRNDPVRQFLYKYMEPSSIKKKKKQNKKDDDTTRPLFSHNSANPIPKELQVIKYFKRLNLEDRTPKFLHDLIAKQRSTQDEEWKKFLGKLKGKVLRSGCTKEEINLFNSQYLVTINNSTFYLYKTNKLKRPYLYKPYIASAGGLASYTYNSEKNVKDLILWLQVVLDHFTQDKVHTYGLHIAFDFPCSVEDLLITPKNAESRLSKEQECYEGTTYFYFTSSTQSRLCIYDKSFKDGGYHPMTRVELVISKYEIKRLGLYGLHRKTFNHKKGTTTFSKKKIKILTDLILKRLGSFNFRYKGAPLPLPKASDIGEKIVRFLGTLHGDDGYGVSPCKYHIRQKDLVESAKIYKKFLEACEKLNADANKKLYTEFLISFLGNEALKNAKGKIQAEAKITKETLNKQIIPYLQKNYRRFALPPRGQVSKFKRYLPILRSHKSEYNKYLNNLMIQENLHPPFLIRKYSIDKPSLDFDDFYLPEPHNDPPPNPSYPKWVIKKASQGKEFLDFDDYILVHSEIEEILVTII